MKNIWNNEEKINKLCDLLELGIVWLILWIIL